MQCSHCANESLKRYVKVFDVSIGNYFSTGAVPDIKNNDDDTAEMVAVDWENFRYCVL